MFLLNQKVYLQLFKRENKKLRVHKDILSEYHHPYWEIEINQKPKFPLDQYEKPVRNRIGGGVISQDDYTQYPCAFCKSEDTELIWFFKSLTNAGGLIESEFKCEKCGLYSFYIEKEFS